LSEDAVGAVDDDAEPAVEDEPPQKAAFRVNGIAWSNRRPMAFINGKCVTIGQSIDGWRVIGIAKKSVTLADDEGTQKQIDLYQGKIEKPKPRREPPKLGNDANY
jgi:type II secretory pathway component PulC